MRRIPLLLTLLLLLSASALTAQSFVVKGIVRDAETGEAISLATVRVSGSILTAMTDDQGLFATHVPRTGVVLEISRLGYQRAYYPLERVPDEPVEIGLVKKDITLAPVLIEAGLQKVLKDDKLYVKDYGFWEEYLFVMVFDENRREFKLAYINERDSIMDESWGPEAPVSLEYDCYGNVHAIGKDFACQLYIDNETIQYYQDSVHLYDAYVRPCIGNVGPYYYYAYRQLNDQVLDYYAHNGITANGDFFFHLEDERRIQQIIDPSELNPFSDYVNSEAMARGMSPKMWKRLSTLNEDTQFEKLAFFKPVDAPLHVVGNNVLVFDHLTNYLRIFSPDGFHKGDIPIDYHRLPKWDSFIIIDKIRGEAYTRYVRNGYSTLHEIDLETGQIGTGIELPREFPEEITVRDGVAYFLYREANYDDTRRLYRYRVKD